MTSRQEVAKKLRESGKWLDSGDTASIREAFYLIDQDVEAPQGREFAPFFNRLADLIDPTCQMSCECVNGDDDTDEYMELIADTPEDTVACHCHACDIVFRFERGIVPDYCPFCGSRVVTDDDNN